MKVKCPYCNKYMKSGYDTFTQNPTRNCVCGFRMYLPRDALYRSEMFITFEEVNGIMQDKLMVKRNKKCPECGHKELDMDLDNNQASCKACGCWWNELDIEEWWIK